MTDSLAVEFEIPQKSGEALCLPPARQLAALARQNAALLEDAPLAIAGVRLAEVRRRARSEISQAAVRYAQRLDLPPSTFGPSDLLLVTGHQPFLFHPGIWLKHVLIDRVARDGMAALSMPVKGKPRETWVGKPRAWAPQARAPCKGRWCGGIRMCRTRPSRRRRLRSGRLSWPGYGRTSARFRSRNPRRRWNALLRPRGTCGRRTSGRF